ncbi:hypothetical protein HAX54_005525 [Datura stramonium]|uniref:Uncharacterized protein n=1 Tax=Datura stramonium TaxID=4076 RepID=A0ABS8T8Y4_DATST|nr:hypothetical protein [Datura stramonium]
MELTILRIPRRKRLTSDENENQEFDSVGTEESKCRKIEGLEELKVVVDQGKSDALYTLTDITVAIKNKMAKSLKQTLMVIIRPKTVNAFQRVKIDQVEFKDDRLRDNSYCAKAVTMCKGTGGFGPETLVMAHSRASMLPGAYVVRSRPARRSIGSINYPESLHPFFGK